MPPASPTQLVDKMYKRLDKPQDQDISLDEFKRGCAVYVDILRVSVKSNMLVIEDFEPERCFQL
jgi:hypothetical protein